jgi:hypothetical protein
VTYRGHTAECQAEFETDPAGYAARAAEERYIENFRRALSAVWCPVTDEITPGGLTQWERLGYTWESCCDFCDDTVQESDFPATLDRLTERGRRAYQLTGGKYFPDASSPLEGAVDFGGGFPDEAPETDTGPEAPAEPPLPQEAAWMSGHELKATYHEGIGLLFEQRCVECHRPGGGAPMSFTTYNGIRSWIRSMKQSVESRGMPPWPADPNVGRFENSRYMTPAEMDLFLEWANAGYPAGTGDFKSSASSGEWNIGEPDHVFELPEYTLGDDETNAIREFEVATEFGEDRWIVAAEAVPGDIYTVTAVEAGPLGSFYPGSSQDVYPASAPRLLKAGETVTVRIANLKDAGYSLPIGATRLGVKFTDDPAAATGETRVDPLANTDFTIPAGAEAFEAEAIVYVPCRRQDSRLSAGSESTGKIRQHHRRVARRLVPRSAFHSALGSDGEDPISPRRALRRPCRHGRPPEGDLRQLETERPQSERRRRCPRRPRRRSPRGVARLHAGLAGRLGLSPAETASARPAANLLGDILAGLAVKRRRPGVFRLAARRSVRYTGRLCLHGPMEAGRARPLPARPS